MPFEWRKRRVRWARVAWPLYLAAALFGILIGMYAKLASILAFGDLWVVFCGTAALITLVFAADFLADYYFKD